MSPSVNILRRAKIDGHWRWMTRGRIPRGTEVRWHVRFRPGGRGPTHNAGTFRTRAEAEERAAWVHRELAAGRYPDLTIIKPEAPEPEPAGPTALDVLDAYTTWRGRRVGASRRNTFTQTRAHLAASPLAAVPAEEVTADTGQDWVDDLTEPTATDDGTVRPGLAPKTVQMHLGVLRAAWRRAAIHPNPWADVAPPRREHDDDVRAPRWDEWNSILDGVPRRHRDTVTVIEATGLRIGELAAQLTRTRNRLQQAERRARILERTLRHDPSVGEALTLASVVYGVPRASLSAVAWCESGHRPWARNGQYRGIFQQGPMFEASPFGRAGLSVWSPYAAALSTAYTVRAQGWRQWSCRPGGAR